MIKYVLHNAGSIEEFIKRDGYIDQKYIPITLHRAKSQLKNPNRTVKDILLITAEDGEEVVGFAGLLPDQMKIQKSIQKVYWLSGLWVTETHRGQGIANNLILQAHEAAKGQLLSSDYVPSTEIIYQKSKLFHTQPWIKQGERYYAQYCFADILPPKHVLFAKTRGLLKVVDNILNVFVSGAKSSTNMKEALKFTPLAQLGPTEEQFLKQEMETAGFKRGVVELNWILANPWIISDAEAKQQEKPYPFSSYSNNFQLNVYRIENDQDELQGLILFSYREGHLKIPFFLFRGDDNELFHPLLEYINNLNIKYLTCFNATLNNLLKKQKLGIFRKPIQRKIMVSKTLNGGMPSKEGQWQDGDGDAIFT